MSRHEIRNVAIIAHVDHGKTTLVDALLRQCGQFRDGELKGACILDSNPLERERGITILSKLCAIRYVDPEGRACRINVIDTPGHADFGGEVERVLRMADGCLLLVDAVEGVMPQTRYVLSKALEAKLAPIVVVNKMDRPQRRTDEVVTEVFDLLVDLGADDHALDFPVVYSSGREGWAELDPPADPASHRGTIRPLFDAIVAHVPQPEVDSGAPLQMLVTTLDWDDYVGRIGIGRVFAGTLRAGAEVMAIDRHGDRNVRQVGRLLRYEGLARQAVETIEAGDLGAVVGLEAVEIGDTLTDPADPRPLPPVHLDEPTLHMTFRINDGPFAGREGRFVTSRHLRERLEKELRSNVALRVAPGATRDEFEVSGRGLLHLGILLENMRREGYELAVGKPRVIYRESGGHRTEPMECLVVDVPRDALGPVMQQLGDRRGELVKMATRGDLVHAEFVVPARGLIGLRTRLLAATAGEAIMHHVFSHYDRVRGPIAGRTTGVMVALETGRVTAHALEQLANRGVMFVEPGEEVYEGQIVGETGKDEDIGVNVTRQKKLTNMRASTKEATVVLKAPRRLELEAALEYLEDDELVELTPASIRLRKRHLKEIDRRRQARRVAAAEEVSS